jgi:DNA-binding winged helix-turn-helix (wHTH) protein
VEQDRQIVFGPFRLDLTTGRLWRGEREIGLRTRTRAVLGYLVTHPRRIIPREEFARHAWAGTHVSKTTLRMCVGGKSGRR